MALTSGVRALALAPQSGLLYRELEPADIAGVTALLAVIPNLYPDGERWLRSRLTDALAGRARCTVATSHDALAGVAIETPKANRRIKLSTYVIDSGHQRLGIGVDLMAHLRERWVEEAAGEVYVTVADGVMPTVEATFRKGGFTRTALEQNRYGLGRHEHVMTWLPPTTR